MEDLNGDTLAEVSDLAINGQVAAHKVVTA
jgi:hypothetical protein